MKKLKSIWYSNGGTIAEREGGIREIVEQTKKDADFILSIEWDEPDSFCFYDIYGNQHIFEQIA